VTKLRDKGLSDQDICGILPLTDKLYGNDPMTGVESKNNDENRKRRSL